MEIKRPIQLYEVRYQCPRCRIGELKFSGIAKMSHPPQNHHECTNQECNYEEYFKGKTYPFTEYV
jgi:hypothetical protein